MKKEKEVHMWCLRYNGGGGGGGGRGEESSTGKI